METVLWSTGEGQAAAALLALIVSLLSLFLLRRRQRRQLHLPPSPFPSLPLLGDALHLRTLTSNPASVQVLRDKLGPIFTLHLGSTSIFFITSAALAHEALIEKGALFAARPQLPSRALFSSNFRNISSAAYGPYWRTMRRNLVHEMLSMPKMLSFQPIRNRVLDGLISRVSAESLTNDGVATLFPNLRTAMFQLLLFMCFGFDMSQDAILEICTAMDEMLMLLSSLSVLDFYPVLRVFAKKRQQQACALRAKQVQIYTSHIEKHKELDKLGQLAPGSYLETLLRMDESTALCTEDLESLCTEFLVGGIDTTVTTLEWTMACLVADPRAQSKLYDEICDVVGSRLVEERDLPNLPYLQAVTKETLRLHPPAHFLLAHTVSEPCKVGGYDIPKNAVVEFHVASISRDEQIWDEPLKFKPERFLATNVDITGTKEVTMIPFGAGRRICPGLGLASIHLELFVARLVQAFEWANPAEGDMVDMEEKPFFTIRIKNPLRALVKERSSIEVR